MGVNLPGGWLLPGRTVLSVDDVRVRLPRAMRQVGRNGSITLLSLRNTNTAPHLGSLDCVFFSCDGGGCGSLFVFVAIAERWEFLGCVASSFFSSFFMVTATERGRPGRSFQRNRRHGCQMVKRRTTPAGRLQTLQAGAVPCWDRFFRTVGAHGRRRGSGGDPAMRVCDVDSRPAILVAPGKSWVEDDVRCCGSLGNSHGKAVVFSGSCACNQLDVSTRTLGRSACATYKYLCT